MKKTKNAVLIIVSLGVLVLIVGGYFLYQNWTIRFASVLDRFFGKGNWECISKETKDSLIYTRIIHSGEPPLSEEIPGKFTNWYIRFDDSHQNEIIGQITDHTYRISQDRYPIFSSKKLSARQALTLELMNISFSLIGDDIKRDFIEPYLSPDEAACIEVKISYKGGNPKPEFYDQLSREDWFNVNEISADHYLSNESHDFYLYIRAHNYRIEKLSSAEKAHLFNSLDTIAKALCDRFGENASFEILFDKDHQVEYDHGKEMISD